MDGGIRSSKIKSTELDAKNNKDLLSSSSPSDVRDDVLESPAGATRAVASRPPNLPPPSHATGHHKSVTILLKLQRNGTADGGTWLALGTEGGPLLAAVVGGGLCLLLLLVLLSLVIYARNRRKANSFSVPSDVSSMSSESQCKGSKDSMVVVTAAAVGHKARLLPKDDTTANHSPFDKDFSFDFSSSIGDTGGYHPTPYSLDPPCSGIPPCPSPCKCWEKENDSGVGPEDGRSGGMFCAPDILECGGGGGRVITAIENEGLKNSTLINLDSASQNSRESGRDPPFHLNGVLEGLACLRVIPIQNSTPQVSSPTQSFSSFKSRSTSKTTSRSDSISNSINNSAAVLSQSLSLMLDDRTSRKGTPRKSSPGKFCTIERCFTNNNKLHTNFNTLHNANAAIEEVTGAHVSAAPSVNSQGKQELMLSLSSDLGFSEAASPTVSPIPSRYMTLPSFKKTLKQNNKQLTGKTSQTKDPNRSYLPIDCSANDGSTGGEEMFNYNHRLPDHSVVDSISGVVTGESRAGDHEGNLAHFGTFNDQNQTEKLDMRTHSLPAWVRTKKGPLVTGEDLSIIGEKEPHWCKKQRNRMRSDAAQIIALSQSSGIMAPTQQGMTNQQALPIVTSLGTMGSSNLVTSLVGEDTRAQLTPTRSPVLAPQAVVVYKERTAL